MLYRGASIGRIDHTDLFLQTWSIANVTRGSVLRHRNHILMIKTRSQNQRKNATDSEVIVLKLPITAPSFFKTADADRREVFHSYSRGLCPECKRTVDGVRVIREGKVYLRKQCPSHGATEALISGDSEWFLRSATYIKPGSVPLAHSTSVDKGCPDDCGLCDSHEQHSCLPIIEITNHCNLECPICLVQNRHNYNMSRDEFSRIIDGLVEKEGQLETINLSGGEPTLHPELFQLLDIALAKKEIARVSVSTNGPAVRSRLGVLPRASRDEMCT